MNSIVLALLVAFVGATLAQDACQDKVKAFRECLKTSHQKGGQDFKAKFESIKKDLDECYTKNGCTAPVRGGKGKGKGGSSASASGESSGEKGGPKAQCFKDLHAAKRTKFEECLKKAGVALPQKDGEHDKPHFGGHKGFNHKDENKGLEGCEKKQQVRECKRALFNRTQPTDAQKKQAFEAGCSAKKECLKVLGSDCQSKLEAFKKAASACHDQLEPQLEQLRASTASCNGFTPRPNRPQGGEKKREKKDYCALGYEAFAADHKKGGRN